MRLGWSSGWLVVGLSVAGAGIVRAESGRVSLEAAIAKAKQSHPEVLRAKALIAAGEAQVDIIGTALNPQLAADATVSVGARPPLDPWDPQGAAEVGLSFGWTLVDFGQTRAAERAARKSLDASREEIAALERDIGLGVEESFYQALAAHELVKVAVVNYEAERRHREEAERFVAAGQRAAIEVARAKTQEARARTEVVRAEAGARLALVYLARAMGVTEVPTGVDGDWPSVVETQGALETAMAQRTELKVARARIEASKLEAEAAELGTSPNLRASARAAFGSTGFEEWDPNWAVGVTLSWPFLDGGRSAAQAEAARATARANEVVLDQLAFVIAADVMGQQTALLSAEAEVEAATAAREAAEVELRLAEARWKEGLGSGIELADAQARLTVTDADRTRAALSRALSQVRLKRALGLAP